MDLSPTDAKLNSINSIDLYKTDEKYDFKLTDILRKRQRPLLLIIDSQGTLLHSSVPDESPGRTRPGALTPRLIKQAAAAAQRHFRAEQIPVAAVVKQVVVNKPGEKCALVVLDNQFYCLRMFPLQGADDGPDANFAALVEPIGDPLSDSVDLHKAKGLFRLSKREVDVLEALMSGGTDKEIARGLGVSAETVRAYLKSIRAKLGCTTRTAIVSLVHSLSNEESVSAGDKKTL